MLGLLALDSQWMVLACAWAPWMLAIRPLGAPAIFSQKAKQLYGVVAAAADTPEYGLSPVCVCAARLPTLAL